MRTLGVLLMVIGAGASRMGPDASGAAPMRGVDVPAAEEVPLLGWSDLSDRPCRWLGRNVRLRVQVESRPTQWNPYVTRFGAGQFDALQAWADEQFPWVQSEFDAPAVRVFARKGSAASSALDGAPAYARFELTGVVREVFLDLPWIEVVEVQPLAESISEASIIHAARAIELMHQGAWELARLELDQAQAAPLPDAAAMELARLQAVCSEARPAGSHAGDRQRDATPR